MLLFWNRANLFSSSYRACGTSGISPNEVCWSNCDAKAECGKNAKIPGQKCPLNVCCGKWGFCGMTEYVQIQSMKMSAEQAIADGCEK
jgi:hypothetical protein